MEYKQVEKSIVRESKVRNVFHKVCKKELFYTNLKINQSAEELLKTSKTLFGYPSAVGGGSCLCISKLSAYGKAPDTPFCIKGHTDPISCFEFSPFNDRVVATGSRDCTIKLWNIEDEDMKSNIEVPLLALPKQSKRITGVYFHPSVDSLFLSATSDHCVDLWDLSQEGQVIQKVTGATDTILSLSWNTWSGGNRFATSSRDKKMRIYDPRSSNLPVQEVVTHEGAQGFKLTWADANGLDLICTVGANKGAQRQLFLWDPRDLSKALHINSITTDSSVLSPYYDYATNMIYLGGKGDGIYYYEIDRSQSYSIGKASFGNSTQSAVSLLPKNVCDVNLCEIDRFLRLTNNQIEMVSFMVPRKSQLFQEDIFPPAPSGDPTTDVGPWFQDKNLKVTPHTISMKPEGILSIYEVSEEEGGKSKQKDKLEQMATTLNNNDTFITEGDVKQEIDGWLFNTYQPRYLKIIKDRLYCFVNEDSAQAVWDTTLVNIKSLDIYDQEEIRSNKEWELRFVITTNNGKEFKIECATVELKDQWISSIHAHREMKIEDDPTRELSPALKDFHIVNNTPIVSPSAIAKGENNTLNNNNNNNSSNNNSNGNNSATSTPNANNFEFAVPSKPAGPPTLKRSHSLLSRNPSYTSLKLSGGMTPPTTAQSNNSGANTPTPTAPPSPRTLKQVDVIIEGSLFELVPGILWNSNVEKWYVVSDGILYSFRTKALKNGEPLETIHLEKAISVHKTKEIFKIEGFSFQLTTPSRIIHLLAKNKDEMKTWISVLRQYLKNSGESKPPIQNKQLTANSNSNGGASAISPIGSDNEDNNNDGADNIGGNEEEEEEQTLEGQMSRKLNGIFSMWGNCYISLLAEDLFVSKNKQATAPELRIQMSSISAIKKLSPNEFTLYDNANVVVCNFRTIPPTEDFDDCARWMEGLEAARKRSIDIIKLFGISDKDLETVVEDELRFIDLTALKNGKSKLLMQIKGKRKIRVIMAKLDSSSLNTHNSFVLDAGPRIFVWAGAKSSRVNRAKALDLANRIRQKERGGKSTLVQLDEGREDSADFWEILGGRLSSPASKPTPEEQDAESTKMSIYRIGNDVKKNSLKARLAWEGTDWRLPNKEILNTKFVYVIDCQTEVFIWIGKESSLPQRKMGYKVALALIAQKDRLPWTKITRINEFGESNLYKEKFANYPGMLPISTTKMEIKANVALVKPEHTLEVLVNRLHKMAVDNEKIFTSATDTGSRIKVWKIEDFEKIDHPNNLYGQFFSGDSYIVLYTYMLNNKEAHVIYYYLGRDSSINDKGTSAYLTVDLHDSLGGQCVQVRVVQNKESRNFLNLFKNKMIVHKGKFNQFQDSTTALYEVRGHDEIDARAFQVDLSAASLNSQHCFILKNVSENTIFIWRGKYSEEIELQSSLSIAQTINRSDSLSISIIEEGVESSAFWNSIPGGKSNRYFDMVRTINSTSNTAYTPRLFICSNSSGINEINEEYPFSQEDLEIGNVAILDVQSHVYVWLGTRSTHRTKKIAMEVLIEYCKQSKFGHSNNTSILIVNPFEEPLAFKSHFRAWTTAKYPKNKLPVQEKDGIPVEGVLKDYLKEVYTYQELLADPLPAGVDATKLEIYLPDDEFEKIFNMNRKEWEKIPVWRRENIKRTVFLF
ncbi:villin [Heterostelium album PN500]|uniref:Villin n=1 Tax=Heterostelium pallidum (strain ATCC 26659 / Pp 5 / PN500) TaxID=670386 RepID=D3BH98_HETP5|nr:villin [Heterostelium album PN500]EFA79075.1 villin [Heterostelium album PN500]|eukprot:XP_020431197.1 villin [Heterostelium album PN500]